MTENSRTQFGNVVQLLNLSIVPNFEGKINVKDKVKNQELEFRKFPSFELTVALTNSYPSNQSPILALRSNFYEPFKQKILESLHARWIEETPVLYDMVCYIQDEMIQEIGEAYEDKMPTDGNGNITLTYTNSVSLQEDFDSSQTSYRRAFDNEEHYCGICMRDLLGDKFTFLSGCEHFYCTDCLTDMAVSLIESGKVTNICCADKDCMKNLNDLDMRNFGLSAEMREKYDTAQLKNAIEQMDDMCWCPLPTCGAIANIEKAENTGRC